MRTAIGQLAKEHLKENRPKMFQALKENGGLEAYLQSLQQAASQELDDLLMKGLQHHEAMEIVTSRYVYVPSEDEEAVLGITESPMENP